VGEDRPHAAVEGLDVVEARQHAGPAVWNVRRKRRQIRAHVGEHIHVHGKEFAIGIERHARMGDVVAAVRVADEMVGSVGNPPYVLL
jgi:hypothetical protein